MDAGNFNEEQLGEDDCFCILQELEAVAHRWYGIGLALGLRTSALDSIKSKGQDVHDLLRNMIIEWLKMSYNVERFGPPTWRRIVEAVRANSGGKNPALADILARKYNVTMQDTQPLLSHTPNASNRTGYTTTRRRNYCCCCWGSSGSQVIPVDGQENDPLLPMDSTTSKPPSLVTQQERNNSSPLHQQKESIPIPTIIAAKSNQPHRCTSLSLPNSPNTISHYLQEAVTLFDSQDGSRDIITAHPSWQMEEIAQQEGYWGAMTGAIAERKLRLHGGGDCYLIRYSERQNHFVVSVMRRNIQNMSQPTYHHFKLNVTKEDGYEIEGSEKTFQDISSLLEYYKTNALTCTNCTIGKACSPPL